MAEGRTSLATLVLGPPGKAGAQRPGTLAEIGYWLRPAPPPAGLFFFSWLRTPCKNARPDPRARAAGPRSGGWPGAARRTAAAVSRWAVRRRGERVTGPWGGVQSSRGTPATDDSGRMRRASSCRLRDALPCVGQQPRSAARVAAIFRHHPPPVRPSARPTMPGHAVTSSGTVGRPSARKRIVEAGGTPRRPPPVLPSRQIPLRQSVHDRRDRRPRGLGRS